MDLLIALVLMVTTVDGDVVDLGGELYVLQVTNNSALGCHKVTDS